MFIKSLNISYFLEQKRNFLQIMLPIPTHYLHATSHYFKIVTQLKNHYFRYLINVLKNFNQFYKLNLY